MVVRTPCSAGDETVTVTPGTARFCWSVTVPLIVPVWTPWAASAAIGPAVIRHDASARMVVIRINPLSP
jgi:hypothetical protein